jgi:inner membrane translocase subunit Tim23
MAASRSFSFEETDYREVSNAPLAPGSVPDFESFGAIDLGSVSPAIGVVESRVSYKPMSKGHEYIFDEEAKQRSFSENLVFCTGAAYLSGVGVGVTLGIVEGVKKMQTLPNASTRLKVNAVMNACSKRAPTFGANLGVLALLFSINERLLCYARDKDDTLNPILGASLTGMMYRSTCGLRPCLGWTLAGGVGMSLITVSGHLTTLLQRKHLEDFSLSSLTGSSN